jgi:Domain of unknown function (DUF4388)/FHA domain
MPSAIRPLALRFLWGHFQGGVLTLERGRSLLIGRQPDADLVIADELISRHHARLAFEGDALVVEDLGSTNGTYLNGARVTRGRVVQGDRLLLGGSLIKVVAGDQPAPATAPAAPERPARAMQGRLEDVPLQDLLQLFATARKTGVLAIQQAGHDAELEVDKGCLVRCVIDGQTDLSARKTLVRLLAWTQGNFELRRASPGAATGGPPPEPLEHLLLEGMRQLDELRRLLPRLPRRFTLGTAPTEDMDEIDLALLAFAAQGGSLEGVLDATPLPDLEAAQRIGVLLTRGFLVGAETG